MCSQSFKITCKQPNYCIYQQGKEHGRVGQFILYSMYRCAFQEWSVKSTAIFSGHYNNYYVS